MACKGCENTICSVTREYLGEENASQLLQLFVDHGIINEICLCPFCDYVLQVKWYLGNRLLFRCSRGHPDYKCSAKIGSFLDNTKLTPQKILHFCIMWCILPNPSYSVIKSELKCSSHTVIDWSSYCREICMSWALENGTQIGGFGTDVELTECELTSGKHHCGRWAFGGVQRDVHSNFFIVPVESRDMDTLIAIIQEWILPGTRIISDYWKSLDKIADERFQQLRVNQCLEFVRTNEGGEVPNEYYGHLPGQHMLIDTNIMKGKQKAEKFTIPVFLQKRRSVDYLTEYLFKKQFSMENRLHYLLTEAAKVFIPEN